MWKHFCFNFKKVLSKGMQIDWIYTDFSGFCGDIGIRYEDFSLIVIKELVIKYLMRSEFIPIWHRVSVVSHYYLPFLLVIFRILSKIQYFYSLLTTLLYCRIFFTHIVDGSFLPVNSMPWVQYKIVAKYP